MSLNTVQNQKYHLEATFEAHATILDQWGPTGLFKDP